MNKIIITQSDITSLGLKNTDISILTAIGFEQVQEKAESTDIFDLSSRVTITYQCDSDRIQTVFVSLLKKLEMSEAKPETVNNLMSLINSKCPEIMKKIKDECFDNIASHKRFSKAANAIADDKIHKLKILYFLDIGNRSIYKYFLVAFSYFVKLDQLTISMIADYVVDPTDQISNISNDGSGIDSFLIFNFYKCQQKCKDYYIPMFKLLEQFRMFQSSNSYKQIKGILDDKGKNEIGQLSSTKAAQLRELQSEFYSMYDQCPVKEGYTLDMYYFPAELMGELIEIYSGDRLVAESYASHERRYPDIANAINNKDYLSAFIRSLAPTTPCRNSYRKRTPGIALLAAEIVLSHSTAALLREISEVAELALDKGIDPKMYAESIEEIKRNMRFFLLSIDKIEYESTMLQIIDFWSSGHYTTDQIKTLISKLYKEKQFRFQIVGKQDAILISELSARANAAYKACEYGFLLL